MNTVVVYPYIVPDTNWLRLAGLCWDKVYRLTSRKAPSDPEQLQELNSGLGSLLESVYPEDFRVTTEFKTWLMQEKPHLSSSATTGHPSNYFAMFDDKLPTKEITDFLIRHKLTQKLGARSKSGAGKTAGGAPGKGNILVRQDVALHYFSMAAAQIAEKKNADLFGEHQEFTLSSLFYSTRALQGNVTLKTLEAYVPQDLGKLPIPQVAELRGRLGEARLKYQSEIQSLTQQFAKVGSEGELKNLEEKITSIAKERIEATRKSYHLVNLNVAAQVIGLSFAPLGLLTWVGSALGIGVFAPASILAGVALGGAKLLIEREKGKLEKDKVGWSYALELERVDTGEKL
jgi:hypothetical protein